MTPHRTSAVGDPDRGSVVVLTSLSLVILVGLASFAVDLGNARQIDAKAQHAADAASLGGARELALGNAGSATAVATQLVDANDMDSAQSSVHIPPISGTHVGDSNCVQVTVNATVDTFFAPVFGFTETHPSATAVACSSGEANPPIAAIFANTTTCEEKSFIFSGSDSTVVGSLHSNDELDIPGSDNVFAGATYVSTSSVGGLGNTFPFGGAPIVSPVLPSPLDFFDIVDYRPGGSKALAAAADPTADYYNAGSDKIDNGWLESNAGFDSVTGILQPGLYYTSGDIDLSGAYSVAGGLGVTFVAETTINVSGSDQVLDPWDDESLLFFSNYMKSSPLTDLANCDSNAISMSGSDISWTGFIYSPFGQTKVNGSGNFTIHGSVVAWAVEISGSGLTFDSQAAPAAPGPVRATLVD